mmetsp:Transcript_95113/g.183386  ORF Transcript_95113/g.183386 Transcript_95113/m.183386 type:complete len:203 (-) Transcript_95113:487-1095(-)
MWKQSPSPLDPCPLPAWQRNRQRAKTLCCDRTACNSLWIFSQRRKLCCSAVGFSLAAGGCCALPPSAGGPSEAPALSPAPSGAGVGMASAEAAAVAADTAGAALEAPAAPVLLAATDSAACLCGTRSAWRTERSQVACCEDDRKSFIASNCRSKLMLNWPGILHAFDFSSLPERMPCRVSISLSCCNAFAKNSPHCGSRLSR